MPATWKSLREGEERIFGFLQLDIAQHSKLPGSERLKQRTKENLCNLVTGLLEDVYGMRLLNWAGDGGSFIFLISHPDKDYDTLVTAALHVLDSMPFFNSSRFILNHLSRNIVLRISCDEGRAHWSKDPGNMHGTALNLFLKYERELGSEHSVTITENLYSNLTSEFLRGLFNRVEAPMARKTRRTPSRVLFRSHGRRPQLLVDDNEVEEMLITVVKGAERFIAVIGGKGGTPRYITELTTKLQTGSLSYYRLITGLPIPHFLCQHLIAVLHRPRTILAADLNEKYGTILATEKDVVMTSASPKGDRSFAAARIPDSQLAEEYRDFMVDLVSTKERVVSEAAVKGLCRECGDSAVRQSGIR